MSRESFVFLLGFLIFIVSFLGIPREWKEWFFIGAGILLMIVGFMLRRAAFLRSIERAGMNERQSEAFTESVFEEETDELVSSNDEST